VPGIVAERLAQFLDTGHQRRVAVKVLPQVLLVTVSRIVTVTPLVSVAVGGSKVHGVPNSTNLFATQLIVERQLAERQQSRIAMGREKFVKEIWKWKDASVLAIGIPDPGPGVGMNVACPTTDRDLPRVQATTPP